MYVHYGTSQASDITIDLRKINAGDFKTFYKYETDYGKFKTQDGPRSTVSIDTRDDASENGARDDDTTGQDTRTERDKDKNAWRKTSEQNEYENWSKSKRDSDKIMVLKDSGNYVEWKENLELRAKLENWDRVIDPNFDVANEIDLSNYWSKRLWKAHKLYAYITLKEKLELRAAALKEHLSNDISRRKGTRLKFIDDTDPFD